jgi:hypothetical protein
MVDQVMVPAAGGDQGSQEAGARADTLLRWIGHALLMFGFAMLMLDIRYEHREAVGDVPFAWIPIVFSGVMIAVIPLAVALWNKGGKYLLAVGYAGAILVGLLGCFFHAHGHFFEHMVATLSVWQSLVTKIDPKSWFPPFFAPLAFDGLGTIGLFFTFHDEIRRALASR